MWSPRRALHYHTCPHATRDQIVKDLGQLRESCAMRDRWLATARAERERWHGKYAIVVAENNALRKKLRALKVEARDA